ncbi:hypothetical protein [Streptomyces sp. NPDC003032]
MHSRLLATAACLLLTAGCGATANDERPRRPDYSVTQKASSASIASADLITPGANANQARAAIRDFARDIDGPDLYFIKVMHSKTAKRYVCRARWYKDAAAYRTHSDRQAQPDSWPHLAINCF